MSRSQLNLNVPRVLILCMYFFFFATHCVALFLFRNNFTLAPDEQGYLDVFRNIYSQPLKGVQDNTGWDGASDVFLWIVYLPAKMLTLLGISDLSAIRILSIGIAALTIVILVKSSGHFDSPRIHMFAIMLFLIPSIFVWTSLGLRESFIYFFLALFFWSLNSMTNKTTKIKNLNVILLAVSSFGLLSTKNYLWAVVLCCLFFVTLIKTIQTRLPVKITFAIVLSIFISITFYNFTSKNDALAFVTSLNASSLESVSTRIPQVEGTPDLIESTKVDENQKSFTSQFKKVILGLTANAEILETHDAKNVPKLYTDNFTAASFSRPFSYVTASIRFLVSPLVFNPRVSEFILIASVESIIWICLIFFIFWTRVNQKLLGTRSDFTYTLALIVLIAFTLMSAGVEINLGTAFRHRSILLIPMAFLLLPIRTRKS